MSETWERGEHPGQAEVHEPIVIDEAEAERMIDAAVQRRIATDSAYRNAEDAEQQSKREWEIEREEEARVFGKYRVI
jgi:hypothetical protein